MAQRHRAESFLHSIRTRMVLSFAGLFALALAALQLVQLYGFPAFGVNGIIQDMRRDAVSDMARIADFKKDQIVRWMADRRANARLVSGNAISETLLKAALSLGHDLPPRELDKHLTSLPAYAQALSYVERNRSGYQVFSEIQMVDATSGRILLSTPTTQKVGDSMADHPLFRPSLQPGRREGMWLDFSPQANNRPIAIIRQIHVPAPDGGLRLGGLMIFRFDLQQAIASLDLTDSDQLGRTGEIIALAANGTILGSVPPTGETEDRSALALAAVSGNEGVFSGLDRNGHKILAAYRTIRISPETGLGLVVKQDEAEVFQGLDRLIRQAVLVGGLFLAVLVILSGLVARRLAHPIRALAQAALSVQNGDFSRRVQARAPGEVGDLVKAFNLMADQVGATHASLEGLVAERTRALEEEVAVRQGAEASVRRLLVEKDALLDTGAVGICMLHDRRFSVCNRHLERMFGYDPGEMLGQSTEILYGDRDSFVSHADLYEALRTHHSAEGDLLLCTKQGRRLWAYVSGRLLDPKDPDGISVWVLIDITRRKEAEENLSRSEERYAEIIQGTNDVVTIVDANGLFLFVNNTASHIFGVPAEQCVGRSAFDFIHPDDRQMTVQAFADWIRQHLNNVQFENRQISLNGMISHLSWNIRIHYNLDGSVARLSAIARDVTDLRKTETALRRTQFSVDWAGEAVFWQDDAGHILYANHAARQLLNMKNGAATGWHLDQVVPPDLTADWQARFAALDVGGQTLFESRLDQSGADPVHVEVHANKVLFDETSHICVFLRNIDMRKATEERLLKTNSELEQFAFIASHDLKEPLRTIILYLALIERRLGDRLDTDSREFMSFVTTAAGRMNELIADLLEYSRIGRHLNPDRRVDLTQVVQIAQSYLDGALKNCSGMIQVTTPLPQIQGEEGELVRLFQNLLGNAIKYRSPDRAPLIQIAATRQGAFWRLTITDNGIGIQPEFHEKIFRVFQRLHAQGAFGGGTGIGLAICRKIVENAGGAIWVDSADPGPGSVFQFTWPALVDGEE